MIQRRHCLHCKESWLEGEDAARRFTLTCHEGDVAETVHACSVDCMLELAGQAAATERPMSAPEFRQAFDGFKEAVKAAAAAEARRAAVGAEN